LKWSLERREAFPRLGKMPHLGISRASKVRAIGACVFSRSHMGEFGCRGHILLATGKKELFRCVNKFRGRVIWQLLGQRFGLESRL
jgi:hypothetical protein